MAEDEEDTFGGSAMSQSIIEVRVTLKGRPVKEFRFSESRVTIGRDPSSNVFLDNPGISREHAILERKGSAIYVQDMGSANGTFLNEDQVQRERVREGDKVRIGKFSLEVVVQEDRRGLPENGRSAGAAFEGTMVLETAQIDRLITRAKEAESQVMAEAPAEVAAHGNALRVPAGQPQGRIHALPAAPPAPVELPQGLAWWKSQAWGLAIGFTAGIAVGALLVRALAG